MHARTNNSATIRFCLPDEALRPFITTLYCTDVNCSMPQPWLEDYLMPEWANLRFLDATSVQTVIGVDEVSPSPDFAVTGPTSRAMRFRIGSGRSWGIGLMPAGWAC
jgi:hypothetical protein